jgi:hypothetical protein
MLNVAIALVLFPVLVLAPVFGNLFWPTTGGLIIFVFATYLYLRFSSARYYLRPDVALHLLFGCSYIVIAFSVWMFKVKLPIVQAFSLLRVFDAFVALATMTLGMTTLFSGLVVLFVRAKSIK